MAAVSLILLFGIAAALGIFMGIRYLRGTRNKPMLIAIHLLLGVAGLEVMALLLRGAPDGTTLSATTPGKFAAGLLVTALLTGLLVPILAKPKPKTVTATLAVHAGIGTAGVLLLFYWIWSL